jgi:hypothetical protein
MKTTELVRKIIRRLSVNDWGALPLDGRMEMVDAINAGLQRLYDALPSQYRITTISTALQAPVTQNLDVVKGGNDVLLSAGPSGVPFTTAQRGSTVVIGDDPQFNEVVSNTQILDQYQGTTGSVQATIYGDAVPIWDRDIVRIVTEPQLSNGSTLYRVTNLVDQLLNIDGVVSGINSNRQSKRQIGTPSRYVIDLVGHSQSDGSTEPVVILRVDPMPDKLYTLRFEAELSPMRITFNHLQQPVNLPVPDNMIESMLLPLCIAELTMSAYWADEKTIPMAQRQAEAALGIAMRTTAYFAKPSHQIRTKPGF